MTQRRFVTLDVFTSKRFGGNPLAVVLDAGGLDTAAMQTIAREFNLSETVFVLPPKDPVNLAHLRIFTPGAELPFAGHPTVGSAVLLAMQNGATIGEDLNFNVEEEVGIVPCTVRLASGELGRARFELPKLPYNAGAPAGNDLIAAALGIEAADIGFGTHVPSRFGVGAPFTMVPLKSIAALNRSGIQPQHWNRAFGEDAHNAAFLYARGGESADTAFQARMFGPGMGFSEDPATGSAAASFSGVLMQFEPPADGRNTLVIEQGYAMGRPSKIVLGMDVSGGSLETATIGGDAVIVSEGTLRA